jgi:hypothetical protein
MAPHRVIPSQFSRRRFVMASAFAHRAHFAPQRRLASQRQACPP